VVGRAELNAAAERMRPRHLGANERGWMVWALPAGDRPVSFPARRKLGHGLDVVGDGVVPWHATRDDGWTLAASMVPLVEPMPGWLVAELGGRYGRSGPGLRSPAPA